MKDDQENLKRMIEEKLTANEAKTDIKLKEFTETIEKNTTDIRGANISGHEDLPSDYRSPQSDGDRFREYSALSKNDVVRRGASRSPQGRCHSKTDERTEEAA